MVRLDQCADQPADADAVTSHMNRHTVAFAVRHNCIHCIRILGPEIENLTDFDPARHFALRLWHLVEQRGVMGFVSPRIGRRKLVIDRLTLRLVGKINLPITKGQICNRTVIKNLAFAGIGQHEEFMGVIPADRSTIGAHRKGLKAHTFVCAQVTDQMPVIGVQRIFFRQVEIIAVFHEELAPAHNAETGANFIPEFPLDVIQRQRQVFVGTDRGPENIGNQFLVRWAIQHVTVVPVLDAQHFLPIVVIAPAFAPKVGRLQRWHQHRNMPSLLLLFVNNVFQLAQHFKAQRQPGVYSRTGLADHARAQHKTVRGDLRFAWCLFQNR